MSNMNSFFDELVHAKQAMERLPEVEAELAKAQGEVSVVRSRLDDAFVRENDLAAQIEALKAALSTKEAQLADATFRQSETADKLAVLVGAFKSVNREINETVELVAPEPKPEPVTTVENAPTDIPGEFVQGHGFEPIPEVASTPVANPTVENTPSVSVSPTVTEVTASPDTSEEASPTSVENPTPTADAPTPDVIVSLTGSASTTSAPASPTTVETQSVPQAASTTPPSKPYAGRPYWHKPTAMSWREWISAGGDKAYWVDEAGNDTTHLDP